MDAFDKLHLLTMKGKKREREIANVIIYCSTIEKNYNKFYEIIAEKLSSLSYQFRISFQFILWDKLKTLSSSSSSSSISLLALSHLAKLYAHLFSSFSLSLAILKILDFSSLSAKEILFLRILFCTIFSSFQPQVVQKIFSRLVASVEGEREEEKGEERGERDKREVVFGLQMFLKSCIKPMLSSSSSSSSSSLVSNPVLMKKNLKAALKEMNKMSSFDF